MIVVLVHRPEGVEPRLHYQPRPFDGIEVQGIYYDAEEKAVVQMMDDLRKQHPDWVFHFETGIKAKIGFNVGQYKIPKGASNR